MAMKNKHKVPLKMWRKWSKQAQHVFNFIYEQMKDQKFCMHPETNPLKQEEWKTIRWNAACIAASACDDYNITT